MPQGFTIGGVTTWALTTARCLAAMGRPVRLVAHSPLDGHARFDPTPALGGVPVEIIDAPSLSTPDGFKESVACYAQLLPSMILPNLCPESYAIAAMLTTSRPEDVRVVSWIHGDNPVDYAYLEYYEPIIHRYVSVSRRCEAAMQTRLPQRAGDMVSQPCGVEIPRAETRAHLNFRPLRIVYAGRMEQGIKRVIDLLAIACRLAERGVKFEMRLVGDGPHADLVDARVAAISSALLARGCRIRREYACPPEAMREVWQWADVLLLASRLEGFSVSMLEAMAAGCIPVVTRIDSGVAEIVRDWHNGLTFPVGDVDAAVTKLARLVENWNIATELSHRACEAAAQHGNLDRYRSRVDAVLMAAMKADARKWPADRPVLMPSAVDPAGAIPFASASQRYDAVVDFIMSRPDASRIVIYGLGVNGLTLVERLRADPYARNRTLAGADDHAHPGVLDVMSLARWMLPERGTWPHDTIAIVTPNDPARIVERIRRTDAVAGVDFVCLGAPEGLPSAADIPREEPLAC